MNTRGHTAAAIKYRLPLQHFSEWAGGRLPGEIIAFEIEGFVGEWADEFAARHGKQPSPDSTRNPEKARSRMTEPQV